MSNYFSTLVGNNLSLSDLHGSLPMLCFQASLSVIGSDLPALPALGSSKGPTVTDQAVVGSVLLAFLHHRASTPGLLPLQMKCRPGCLHPQCWWGELTF